MFARTARCTFSPLVVLLLANCADLPTVETSELQFSAAGGVPQSATLTFGQDGVGSPFPPPSGHDASGHAYDKILPHVVNIAAGGSVTINIGPFHAAAEYIR